jgi:hypothetical protein
MNCIAKLQTFVFHTTKVEFLGHVVTPYGIKMDVNKVKPLVERNSPSDVKDVRSFLGFDNYYKFIRNFYMIAKPLHSLTKKGIKFEWKGEHQNAFDNVRHHIITALVLSFADLTKPFIVETDASDFALGCLLLQMKDDNKLYPIAFYSKKFTDDGLYT